MRRDSLIVLIGPAAEVTNDIGNTITTPRRTEVFAEKKSIKQSEFYQAAANGFKPELTFVIWNREYNLESKLEHTGKDGIPREYNIIRTYDKSNEEIELICAGIVGTEVRSDG